MKTKELKNFLSPPEDVILWAAVSTKAQDKYSVEDQLKIGRQWCADRGSHIVDELIVRGFSRDYWTLADVVAASSHDPDMAAFAQLQAHIRARDFGIFACLDADRFGRTASLVHEVLGRITRDCQAKVVTLVDGVWINEENAPVIGLIKGYKAQHDITRLREYRLTGFDNRARTGKSIASTSPMFHQIVRDEKGKEVGVVVKEALRPLWAAVAALLLRGIAWGNLEAVLFEEYSFGVNGKPYPKLTIRKQVLNYAFWGSSAINGKTHKDRYVYRVGAWIWDEHVPPPPPTKIYRNVYPAVYSGEWAELGEQVKAELWRRVSLRGKATAKGTFRFHGLLVCDDCGYSLSLCHTNRPSPAMRCDTHTPTKRKERGMECAQTRMIRVDKVQQYFHAELQKRLDDLPSDLFQVLSNSDTVRRQITGYITQRDRLIVEGKTLTSELGRADDFGREMIRNRMSELSAEVKQTNNTIATLELSLAGELEIQQSQQNLVETLKKHGGVAWLWQQPNNVIHQYLSTALGGNRVVVRNGIIIGSHPAVSRVISKRQPHSS